MYPVTRPPSPSLGVVPVGEVLPARERVQGDDAAQVALVELEALPQGQVQERKLPGQVVLVLVERRRAGGLQGGGDQAVRLGTGIPAEVAGPAGGEDPVVGRVQPERVVT